MEVNFDHPPRNIKYMDGMSPAKSRKERPQMLAQREHSKKRYPKHPPPEAVILPFLPIPESASRYVEIPSYGSGNQMRTVYSKKVKPLVPGWLIKISDAHMKSILSIENKLKAGGEIEDLTDSLFPIINDELQIPTSKSEIFEMLRVTPDDPKNGGFSFSHFMYGMGNMEVAKAKDIFLATPRPVKDSEKYNGSGDNEEDNESKENETEKPDNNEEDESGYSLREKYFYSGMFIVDMYDTIHEVKEIYYKGKMPDAPAKKAKKNKKSAPDDAGVKKRGAAEWDKPLPPLPKVSPYITSVPFVTTRWNIQKPNLAERGRRRTLNKIQPLHMMIKPPQTKYEPILIMENRIRIRNAMVHLASTGNIVAMLPDIHFLIHLSDTFVDKQEHYSMKPISGTPPPIIYHNNDVALIAREAKKLYRPHGLPIQVAKLKPMIQYTDALNLRAICDHIRKQHWNYICSTKLEFREFCWKLMHVDRIPFGQLRDSFVSSFVTYLPYVSHLPI